MVLVPSISGVATTGGAAPASAPSADAALDSAITQFVRSPGGPPLVAAVVSVNEQISPKSDLAAFDALRRIDGLAVCAALARPKR